MAIMAMWLRCLVLAFLSQSCAGLLCIDTKALFQQNACCAQSDHDIPSICVTGTSHPMRDITLRINADQVEHDSSKAFVFTNPDMIQSVTVTKPTGCGNFCKKRTIHFVFSDLEHYKDFMHMLDEISLWSQNFVKSFDISIVQVIAGQSQMSEIHADANLKDQLKRISKKFSEYHSSPEAGISHQLMEPGSFTTEC